MNSPGSPILCSPRQRKKKPTRSRHAICRNIKSAGVRPVNSLQLNWRAPGVEPGVNTTGYNASQSGRRLASRQRSQQEAGCATWGAMLMKRAYCGQCRRRQILFCLRLILGEYLGCMNKMFFWFPRIIVSVQGMKCAPLLNLSHTTRMPEFPRAVIGSPKM
jgi:hypothetical protein